MSVFQVPRCDFVFIPQPGAVLLGLGLFYYHCLYFERDGWLFCAQCRFAAGVLFLLSHDMALLLCDKGHVSPFKAIAGDGCHSKGPGPGLMSDFYILGREPQAYCVHMVFHGLPLSHSHSLTHVTNTGDAVVNKKPGKQ